VFINIFSFRKRSCLFQLKQRLEVSGIRQLPEGIAMLPKNHALGPIIQGSGIGQ
jgi:hypothetical protein